MNQKEYSLLSDDFAHCAGTYSEPVFAAYSLHVAQNEYEGTLYALNSYVEISIDVLYTTLSLKTICCHF